MAQRFTGTLLGEGGKKLEGVKVTLKSGTVSQVTTTNADGFFNITTPNDIDSKNTTITFSKDKFTLYKIKNPQPTGAYIPAESQIDVLYGGVLNLKNSFEAGKYLISSLKSQEQETLYWELFNVSEFIKENPGNYNIVVVASESTITNYDREEFLEDGSPNPNWAGPSGVFNTPALPPKSISDKRYNSLKKYIENFFKENGSPIPTIESEIRVGGANASDQYVRLEVRLTQVNCKPKEVNRKDDKMQGEQTLIKPPGATKITLDAYQFPDRFGINGKYINYYTQAPNTKGSVMSWEFIVYLSLFGTPLLNDDTIVRKEFNMSTIKTQLLADILLNENIELELIAFIKKSGGVGSSDPNLANQSTQTIIDLAIQNSVGVRSPIAYGYPIKRENTVISLEKIGTNASFILNQRKGVIAAPSVYSFNICDNRL
jgi:hypothetical protein